MVTIVVLVLLSLSVQGLPAPLGVLGTVTDGGEPLQGIEVVLKAVTEDKVIVSDSVITNSEGMFYAMVTLDESVPVDIHIIISSEESYVELIEGARGWERYVIALELSDDTLGIRAPPPEYPLPGIVDFEEDLEALIANGSVNDALVEKYGIDVSEVPVLPVVEEPLFVPAPRKERSSRLILEVGAVLVLLLLFFASFNMRR